MYIFMKNVLCEKCVYILNIFIYNIKYKNINIYMYIFSKYLLYVFVFIYIHNKYTQCTYIYYVNKNCD